MYDLHEKQLSFLLHAGCDTLPTPMNLARLSLWELCRNKFGYFDCRSYTGSILA